MIIVSNKYIPFVPYDAMCIWPCIFVKEDVLISQTLINHETTHGLQQIEIFVTAIFLAAIMFALGCGWWSLLALPLYFYIYCFAYLLRRFDGKGSAESDYRSSVFEREAYANERDDNYNKNRRLFAWVKYI